MGNLIYLNTQFYAMYLQLPCCILFHLIPSLVEQNMEFTVYNAKNKKQTIIGSEYEKNT
jgi:hypothetical protein